MRIWGFIGIALIPVALILYFGNYDISTAFLIGMGIGFMVPDFYDLWFWFKKENKKPSDYPEFLRRFAR